MWTLKVVSLKQLLTLLIALLKNIMKKWGDLGALACSKESPWDYS